MKTKKLVVFAAAVPPLLLVTPAVTRPAWADLKIVSTVAVTGGENRTTPDSTTYTTFYKGRKARLESSDGTITLYDRESDKVYTVNPGQKTYYVRSFKDALQAGRELPEQMRERLGISSHVDLDEVKKGDAINTRAVAGQNADQYTLYTTVKLSPKETRSLDRMSGGGMGGMGGGRRGGGFPGRGGGGRGGGGGMPPGGGGPGGGQGGTPPGGGQRGSGPTAQMSFSGDVWAVDAEKLLPSGKKDEKDMALALVCQTLPTDSPALSSLADSFAKKHLLPLASRVSRRVGNTGSAAVAAEAATAPAAQPLVVEMQVTSLDNSVSLSDDLFRLPDGYDRVEPPAPKMPFAGQGMGPQSSAPSTPPPAP